MINKNERGHASLLSLVVDLTTISGINLLVTPIRGFLDYSKQEDPPYAWVAPSGRKQLVSCLLALTLTGQIMDPIDLDSTSILRNFLGVPTPTKAMHLSRNPPGPRCRIRSVETSNPWTEQLDNQVLGLPSRRKPLLDYPVHIQ